MIRKQGWLLVLLAAPLMAQQPQPQPPKADPQPLNAVQLNLDNAELRLQIAQLKEQLVQLQYQLIQTEKAQAQRDVDDAKKLAQAQGVRLPEHAMVK
jgi:nucleotide-binding universal stress UspA family protein